MDGKPSIVTFAAVARQVAGHGWRPFPGLQTSKVPAMQGWSGLNQYEWDLTDLASAIADYQPTDNYCCCLAVQREIVVIDADIVDHEHAAFAHNLADDILGVTPLLRIGQAPKCIRVYRAGDSIKSRKLHPLEIFCGSGQVVGFGGHAKAGRPYVWPQESPLTLNTDSPAIPAVKQAQIERFTTELFRVVPRRLLPTKQSRSNDKGAYHTIGERLRILTTLHGSWKRAAAIVLSEACEGCFSPCEDCFSEACEGCFNDTLWAIVTSAAGRGIPEAAIWELVNKRFRRDPTVSEVKILASMIERTRPVPRPSLMTFTPTGDCDDR